MFLLIMITPGIIVVSVGEELSEHLLNVVQGFLLGLGSLLLSFQPSTEVIITVISHMHRHSVLRTELTIAEEAYSLSPPHHQTIEITFSLVLVMLFQSKRMDAHSCRVLSP